jgi:hypothetical protein
MRVLALWLRSALRQAGDLLLRLLLWWLLFLPAGAQVR